ncbi:uncharacterized protein LOC107272454 [Cephus cinctus]|uniref:Uncharacterized protein LOC107272454 n=1 Tax=Cephus cinctus TaxID=211228 RepID=A0AAJ7W6C2_CEPCN|nr:uncharacterized protein LOC107272454 [Cephus cinctus]XP_024945502.1 uncharacterized protein LOC107272454 [Cephus cinctus]
MMSHSVTIRTATVTSNSSAIIINTGYLKSFNGLLKFLQLALGIVCVGIMGHQFNQLYVRTTADLFFLLIVTTFMIATFILILSCLASISTESIISKTIYELIYHSIGFGLLLACSLTLLVRVNDNKYSRDHDLLLGASICGLVNSALYLLNTIMAVRAYRGL